jgi:hypothetical protein
VLLPHILGGADHLIFYPWEANTTLLQAIFDSDGVSAVYSFISGDECTMGTHDCPQDSDCIFARQGFGRYGFDCNCSTGYYEVPSITTDPREFTCFGMLDGVEVLLHFSRISPFLLLFLLFFLFWL